MSVELHWRLIGELENSQTGSYFVLLLDRLNRIAEIASTNKQPWDLISWVKQQKLPVVKAICFQGQPCNDLSDLWRVLHLL